MINFLQIFGTLFLVALIPLLTYALTSCGKDFDVVSWLVYTRTRLGIGFLLLFILSLCLAFVPEASDVLNAVGFNTGKSVTALGLALGAMLVTSIRGNSNGRS